MHDIHFSRQNMTASLTVFWGGGGWPVLTMLDIHFACSSVTPINLVFSPSHAEKKTEHFLALISVIPYVFIAIFI